MAKEAASRDFLNGLDLFSGYGGLTLALQGWVKPLAYCEIDRYAQAILLSRMSEAILPRAPIWDDIKTLSGTDFRGAVDIIYGGFPCQNISVGGNGKGLAGEQSQLFWEILRLAEEIKPQSYSLKTSQQSEQEALVKLGSNWPKQGMIVDGVMYPLQKLELHTKEKDGFYWPTPTASEAGIIPLVNKHGKKIRPGQRAYNPRTMKHTSMTLNRFVNQFHATGKLNPCLTEWMMGLPLEWTALNAAGMELFPNKQGKLSRCC